MEGKMELFEKYMEIACNEGGFSYFKGLVFTRFMMSAFPHNEPNYSYTYDWLDRFAGRDPTCLMDKPTEVYYIQAVHDVEKLVTKISDRDKLSGNSVIVQGIA